MDNKPWVYGGVVSPRTTGFTEQNEENKLQIKIEILPFAKQY